MPLLCSNMIKINKIFFLFLFLICSALPCGAQDAGVVRMANTDVEMIAEYASIAPGQSFWVGLRMKMDPHWHTYWVNAGDSGVPPKIDWNLPPGFKAGDIQWPQPMRIDVPPLTTYGFEGEIFLLTQIQAPADLSIGSMASINATVGWLSCKEICVPGRGEFTIDIPVVLQEHVSRQPRFTPFFEKAITFWPIQQSNWDVKAYQDHRTLIISLAPPEGWREPINTLSFYPYRTDLIQHTAIQKFIKKGKGYELFVPLSEILPEGPVERVSGILVGDIYWQSDKLNTSLQIDIPVEERSVVSASMPANQSGGLLVAVLFAFLGGIILNLMPCVLPVLSIKILNLVEKYHENRKEVLRHSLVFTFGIIFAFWVLAGLLLVLKFTGKQIGWGFQFQSPGFIIFMAALFFWMGLNLFGVFEIGTSLTRAEQNFKKSIFTDSSFFNGVLATIVATPCTAPFMGSALGFALVRPPVYAFLIFTFLGLGMAFPYLVLTQSPSLLKFIPKPGKWMLQLKKFFGLLFMATVLWLTWVLGVQRGVNAVMGLSAGLFLIGVAAWILGKWGSLHRSKQQRQTTQWWVVVFVVLGLALAWQTAYQQPVVVASSVDKSTEEGIAWRAYQRKDIDALIKANKRVFIDFTASWCLSCQVNERVVFRNPQVIAAFKEKNIIAIKADWTNYDEEITQALARFGKASIPVYVLYPGQGEEVFIMLPEIITPGIMLDALQKI